MDEERRAAWSREYAEAVAASHARADRATAYYVARGATAEIARILADRHIAMYGMTDIDDAAAAGK